VGIPGLDEEDITLIFRAKQVSPTRFYETQPREVPTDNIKSAHINVPPVLIAAVCVSSLIYTALMALVWHKSRGEVGTTSDPDYFLSMQNSTMSVLGILCDIYPTLWTLRSAVKLWAMTLSSLGVALALRANPMYPLWLNIWSALASFSCGAIQSGITLELFLACLIA